MHNFQSFNKCNLFFSYFTYCSSIQTISKTDEQQVNYIKHGICSFDVMPMQLLSPDTECSIQVEPEKYTGGSCVVTLREKDTQQSYYHSALGIHC